MIASRKFQTTVQYNENGDAQNVNVIGHYKYDVEMQNDVFNNVSTIQPERYGQIRIRYGRWKRFAK
jgi:hypothetical protein